ncbi:hypothetical protein L6164_003922 [Bauhinia variegata]|uniref:Uncharacterized protein n=1 Tax=Bauhinia variegata TaxID=167791 RepID=A0ACB9Q2S5_BAUVA|nr:hypothetical protein L6164_003922 [Bauhinia variegata]
MEMKIISEESIRPSTPTPPPLRHYHLSFLDQLIYADYIPLIFFYPTDENISGKYSSELKNSLSETLSRYYPFAGRIKDSVSIECNDEGALFIEARVKHSAMEVIENPRHDFIEPLFPNNLQWKRMQPGASLVAAQVNYFDHGGIAIAVCMSHKVGDLATMGNFINDWAAIARSSEELDSLPLPTLNSASIFEGDLAVSPDVVLEKTSSYRRFVFNACKINELKKRVSSKVQNPTRVQVVSALIYKCAISASRSLPSLASKRTALIQSVNLRGRMAPSLPEKSVGNMNWIFFSGENGEAMELDELAKETRGALQEFCGKYAKRFRSIVSECLKEALEFVGDENRLLYRWASWCRFGMYEADFGFGKPRWVTSAGCVFKNQVILMDWRDGDGIEAIVNLDEQAMTAFENDENLLAYASPSPSYSLNEK